MKPESVLAYNKAKKGVDMSDQMSSYATALRRTLKWYHKLAVELLTGTCIVNAWVLYNKYYSPGKPISITDFKQSIVMSFLKGKPEENIKPGPRRSQIEGTQSEHSLTEATGPKAKTRRRCRSCYEILSQNEGISVARKKARRVNTYCENCEGKPFFLSQLFHLETFSLKNINLCILFIFLM
ncbi:uncharacterized protein [Palaemon carinicauda]|uniref:uncharacterized protein n=1 Tax=Palaemon carinicauda TaxID=392227 RepID=UPI0035B6712C